jgi:hypothetical protein
MKNNFNIKIKIKSKLNKIFKCKLIKNKYKAFSQELMK